MKQFLLSSFEEHIDEVILNRGREYAFNQRVVDIQEVSPGRFTAVVEGSELARFTNSWGLIEYRDAFAGAGSVPRCV